MRAVIRDTKNGYRFQVERYSKARKLASLSESCAQQADILAFLAASRVGGGVMVGWQGVDGEGNVTAWDAFGRRAGTHVTSGWLVGSVFGIHSNCH